MTPRETTRSKSTELGESEGQEPRATTLPCPQTTQDKALGSPRIDWSRAKNAEPSLSHLPWFQGAGSVLQGSLRWVDRGV